MKMNCLIVDDEQHARRLLTDYTSKIPELNLVASAKNAIEALQILRENEIDIMLLDIQMPDLTGVELLRSLKNKPVVIFTTAYKEYALEGYELDVTDYMLKPISFERFLQGINKSIEYIKLKTSFKNSDTIVANSTNQTAETINLKADYKIYRVRLNDILYIEGLKEYVTFYTSQRKYIVLESLKRLEETLPNKQFRRVHKSYIVNTHKIDALYGNTLEIGKTEIPIGKSYADEVKSNLFGIKNT